MTVAKTVLLDEQNHVLVLRRSQTDSWRPGEMDFPGGSVDPGEDIMAAASREIAEESGLIVPADALQLVYAGTQLHEDKSVNRLLFAAHLSRREVTLSFEHDKADWMPLERVIQEYPKSFYATGLRYAADNGLLP